MKIGIRVKRCGKSAPVPAAMSGAVRLMGCKAKYIPGARQDGPFCPASGGTGRGRLQDRISDDAAR